MSLVILSIIAVIIFAAILMSQSKSFQYTTEEEAANDLGDQIAAGKTVEVDVPPEIQVDAATGNAFTIAPDGTKIPHDDTPGPVNVSVDSTIQIPIATSPAQMAAGTSMLAVSAATVPATVAPTETPEPTPVAEPNVAPVDTQTTSVTDAPAS